MAFFRSIGLVAVCSVLACCGGDNTTTDSVLPASDQSGSDSAMVHFEEPLQLNSSQLAGMYSFVADTQADFNSGNRAALVSPDSVELKFRGGILAKMGENENYLGSNFELTLDTSIGAGSGRAAGLSMSGSGVENALMDFLSSLNVEVTDISGSAVQGRIFGEFSDVQAFDSQFSEEFEVNATFNGRIVGTEFQSVFGNEVDVDFIGILDGTIKNESGETELLKGVFACDQELF